VVRCRVNVAVSPRDMVFEVAPKDALGEVRYWRPMISEVRHPIQFLGREETVSLAVLSQRMYPHAPIDDRGRLPKHYARLVHIEIERWTMAGWVILTEQKGSRRTRSLMLSDVPIPEWVKERWDPTQYDQRIQSVQAYPAPRREQPDRAPTGELITSADDDDDDEDDAWSEGDVL
jgi:hypothetical protein